MKKELKNIENYFKTEKLDSNQMFILYAWFGAGILFPIKHQISPWEALLPIMAGIALFLHYRKRGKDAKAAKTSFFKDLESASTNDIEEALTLKNAYSRKTRKAIKEYLNLQGRPA